MRHLWHSQPVGSTKSLPWFQPGAPAEHPHRASAHPLMRCPSPGSDRRSWVVARKTQDRLLRATLSHFTEAGFVWCIIKAGAVIVIKCLSVPMKRWKCLEKRKAHLGLGLELLLLKKWGKISFGIWRASLSPLAYINRTTNPRVPWVLAIFLSTSKVLRVLTLPEGRVLPGYRLGQMKGDSAPLPGSRSITGQEPHRPYCCVLLLSSFRKPGICILPVATSCSLRLSGRGG